MSLYDRVRYLLPVNGIQLPGTSSRNSYSLLATDHTPDDELLHVQLGSPGPRHWNFKFSRTPSSHRSSWLAVIGGLGVFGLLGLMVLTMQASSGRILRPGLGSLPPEIAAAQRIDALFARQSRTLAQARSRYRLKTNRLPPKNYNQWFKFAQNHSCLIDEYDQIYNDFEPFYQLAKEDPQHFQRLVDIVTETANGGVALELKTGEIRNGTYEFRNDVGTLYNGDWPRTINRFSHFIPDMNFTLNGRDEPRVLFNYRNQDAMAKAFSLTDLTPFQHSPKPSSAVFADQKMCIIPNQPTGFTSSANNASAFMIYSSNTDYATDLYPMLSVARISPCFADILVPSEFYYGDSGWSPKYPYPNNITWEDKQGKLYWRGASSGGIIAGTNYHSFPRFHLVDLGRNHSDIIDVAITVFQDSLCSEDCDGDAIMEEYGITNWGAPREETYNYKYVMDVDGNSFSGRYFGLLRSGSLVFKSTIFEEYFNNWLRPYEHFIPVLPDMSDLVEKVEWAIANDDEAHRIQESGRQFAERVLTDAQNDCYFSAVLLEWARLQEMAAVKSRTDSKIAKGSLQARWWWRS